jgi:hypothetical protein
MASFTGVGDSVTLKVPARGETVDVAISGTYDMTIQLQREQGSPGSGSWEVLKEFNTANATEAFSHLTAGDNESLRLIVTVDTSGTATATLAENSNLQFEVIRDEQGNPVAAFTQEGLELYKGLFHDPAGSNVVDVTSAAVTITKEAHAGRVVTLNKADGVTATMPAATGTGDVYTFFVGTTITSVGAIIQAASAADVFNGGVAISTDIAGVTMLAAATTDTITMNGTTTGGVVGSFVKLTDVAPGVFLLEGFLASTGAEATPFSAAV